jgi:antitoxin (DNA-binding transcriptional repressor) of toxin-antitoxin stability system
LRIDTYSVVEAQRRLSELIDRAVQGEAVVIARDGRPVAELKAIPTEAGAITPADLDCSPSAGWEKSRCQRMQGRS